MFLKKVYTNTDHINLGQDQLSSGHSFTYKCINTLSIESFRTYQTVNNEYLLLVNFECGINVVFGGRQFD